MKVIEAFPHKVREIENCWIELSDGCRLAARIWLPEGAEASPVPAIFEYIPYRKRDYTSMRDNQTHGYFAGHGYACLRVDFRGCGDSEETHMEQFSKQEQDDAVDVLKWIAAHSWCNGSVGMFGLSWGGFGSLLLAAKQQKELKAIIALSASDDRYDSKCMGGCVLTWTLAYAGQVFGYNTRPPDPVIVGERWREMWLQRLESGALVAESVLRHQRRDDYWRNGSVCEDYEAISCPVFVIGGAADPGYCNFVFRLLANLKVPRKGLIGPWAHKYPHLAVPGPAIGFLQEALRWWDQWLKGLDTGIMDEPMLRVWMHESVHPRAYYDERPGRWVAETSWPAPGIKAKHFAINSGTLDTEPATETRLDFKSSQTVGLDAGEFMPWFALGPGPELASDQRKEDGNSLTFDSAPLEKRLEILGAPVMSLDLAVDRPAAFVAVRLCDVAPDGASSRVTYGLLNLTHRKSHVDPGLLEPDRRYTVRVQLNNIAYAFPEGHRIRVGISTTYWPMVWPSPEPVTLSLFTGSSSLELPVRKPKPEDNLLKPYKEPEGAAPMTRTELRPVHRERTVRQDLSTGETVYTVIGDDSCAYRIDAIDLEVEASGLRQYRIIDENPLSAQEKITWTWEFRRKNWSVRTETCTTISATKDAFVVKATLDAYEGDDRVFCKSWNQTVSRDMV